MSFKTWTRGFFFDPELEKKAHKIADEALKASKKVNKTLNKIGNVQDIVIISGLGLLIAGFVAGSMSKKKTSES